jgi:hypothetical protein
VQKGNSEHKKTLSKDESYGESLPGQRAKSSSRELAMCTGLFQKSHGPDTPVPPDVSTAIIKLPRILNWREEQITHLWSTQDSDLEEPHLRSISCYS